MKEVTIRLLEGLAAGGLEGLAAAGFYIHFFGPGMGAVLAGTGIGFFSFAAFWQPGLWPWILALSAFWMMLAGGIDRIRQRQELFLAGGTWLMVCSFACLWPGSVPLQMVSALALFEMTALYLLCRGRLYPLWMGMLLCLWLLAGFFEGMVYGKNWQEQVMKAASFLVLGGIFVFQQIFCIRQEMERRIWEEAGEREEYLEKRQNDWEAEKEEKRSVGGEVRDWRKAARQEYRRLQIFEHDFRHHLDMLGALYEEGSPTEARAYLEDLKQARFSGQGQKNGGERELSCIMLAKREACRRAGIAFSCQILGSPQGIAQMDMTALLLNLLDNAIRACEKVPAPRSIGIMLLARGELWQIELVNTGRYELQGAGGKGVGQESQRQGVSEQESQRQEVSGQESQRQESSLQESSKPAHGIGLVSVRQIVEKYQGTFEIRQEGDLVVQKVILAGRFPE